MPNAMATMTTNAPKSGSSSSRPPISDHHREQRQEAAQQRLPQRLLGVQERRLAHRVARRVQHDGELHELRRLQVDDDERQPAPRAVDRLADARDQHQHEQHARRRRTATARAAARPSSAPGTRRAAATSPTATNIACRARKYHGAVAGVRRRLGHRDRRRIHHHQADREQQQRRPRERHVVGGHRARMRAAAPRAPQRSGRSRRDAVAATRLRMTPPPQRAARTQRGEALAALDVVANWSRLAHAGDSSTASPARASAMARATARIERAERSRRAPRVPCERARDQRRVAADQQHRAAVRIDGGLERRESPVPCRRRRRSARPGGRCRRAPPAWPRPSCPSSRR